MRPFVARRVGTTWKISRLMGFEADAAMADIDGARPRRGFLAARGDRRRSAGTDLRRQRCEAATRKTARGVRRAELSAPAAHAVRPEDPQPPARLGLAAVPPIRTSPPAAAGVSIVDRAAAAGLPTAGATYGAVVRDFDGNGQEDVFLGGHGDRAELDLNKDGAFARSPLEFGIADRHGCTATDADGSGLPDLYCTFGGGRGLGVKANELWLDPGGSNPRLTPDAGGVRELLGRGRVATVLD